MNTETLATRIGANWSEVCDSLRTAGLDYDEIERVRLVPAKVNNRLTRCLGRVSVCRTRGPTVIELSGQLVQKGEKDEIIAIYLHEVAHLVASFQLVGAGVRETAHGPTWRRWARTLGVSATASTTTTYVTEGPGLKTVAVCNSCGFELQKVRRLRLGRTYSHRRCGGAFIPR